MVKYRRNKLYGNTFFFTVVLQHRKSNLLTEHISLLRQAFRIEIKKNLFKIVAIVVLPDHIHTIWELPEHDRDYCKRWKSIKSRFTRSLIKNGVPLYKNNRGEYNVWQRRFWEHTIRDEKDLVKHINYINFNPVKHNLVENYTDWPYTSVHRDFAMQSKMQVDDLSDIDFGE